MSSIEKPIDTEEAALFLNISAETLRRKAQAGEVPACKPGKGWVFIKEDLIKYIRSMYHGKSIVYALDENLNEGKEWQLKDVQKKKALYGTLISSYQTEKDFEGHLKRLIR